MRSFFFFLILATAALLTGCFGGQRPQRGGTSKTSFGGGTAPSSSEVTSPENPQTSSTTTIRKTTTREYLPGGVERTRSGVGIGECSHGPGVGAEGSSALRPAPVMTIRAPEAPVSTPVREIISEEAVTSIGSAQKDTSRELGARLQNMRGVQWVGILLLIVGPVLGFKLGWFTNGLIAGGVGLGLIILAQVLPGNEAWLGLLGLLVMPIVAYAYYKAHHDARSPASTAAAASSSTDSK